MFSWHYFPSWIFIILLSLLVCLHIPAATQHSLQFCWVLWYIKNKIWQSLETMCTHWPYPASISSILTLFFLFLVSTKILAALYELQIEGIWKEYGRKKRIVHVQNYQVQENLVCGVPRPELEFPGPSSKRMGSKSSDSQLSSLLVHVALFSMVQWCSLGQKWRQC